MTVTLSAQAPWLLLMFRLPARQASRRVEVWRKLRRYGALPLRSSGYVLPNTPAGREHFEWLAASIRRARGEASVVQVHAIDDLPSEELRRRFLEASTREYEQLLRHLRQAAAAPRKSAGGKLTRLRQRLQQVVAIDFFSNPLRSRVEAALTRAESAAAGSPPPSTAGGRRDRKEYRRRTWMTRPRPGIDRVASAWLIRRFIDPEARFVFGDDPARHPKAVPFDMFQGGGFGHRGDDCTFETLQKEFGIRDPRVSALAQIIHDADLGDEKFGRREGEGVERVLLGWAQQDVSDDELLRRGIDLMEGLYRALP
ncbi:MAG TPA: chromate resistance protein ChrB domain-containing protein [Terriglobales bacterium]|nr:chromate resistance protein ChrB domain-containing protein [Terriglobales bacterium]